MAALPIVLTACGPATPSVGMWDFAIAERDVRLAPGEEVALTLDVVAGAGALRGAVIWAGVVTVGHCGAYSSSACEGSTPSISHMRAA